MDTIVLPFQLLQTTSFDYERLDPSVQQALDKAAVDGLKGMYAKLPTFARVANGWQMNTDTMGVF
jgi:hypothetical protein